MLAFSHESRDDLFHRRVLTGQVQHMMPLRLYGLRIEFRIKLVLVGNQVDQQVHVLHRLVASIREQAEDVDQQKPTLNVWIEPSPRCHVVHQERSDDRRQRQHR